MGNILMTDKSKFVFIDFERCTPQKAFADTEERQLLSFLDKLYMFRFFFDLAASSSIELHKKVHDLFVTYFEEQLRLLIVDDEWSTRFGSILRANNTEDENYSAFISSKRKALDNVFHTKLFKHQNKKYVFHQYLLERRFKKLECIKA